LEESPDDCSSCVTTDTDTDSLASWTNSDKSGVAWDFEEQINTELPCRSKRRSRVTDFDLKEIFWKISLENNPNTFLEEMHNLPSWESPDIFLDSEDDSEDNLTGREDSLEIFQFIKHIFNEPQEKSWNEEQKFGSSWDHHIKYYEVRAAEAPRSEKEWNQSQLDELIDSLDTVNLLVEPAITSTDLDTVNLLVEPAITSTDQNKMLSIAQQDFNWSETAKFGSSWERHLGDFSNYSHSESELPGKTYIWSSDKILQIIHRLQSVDFNESFLKDLVLNEDSVEIFEENKGIFEDNTEDFETAPSWSGEHRFGASWESFIPEYDGQDRNINWSFAHKFGLSWAEQLADIEEAAVKQLRKQVKQKRRKIVFDLLDIFWEIALDKRTALLEPKLCEILRNLPASEGPDVFLDSSLMFYEPAAPKNCVSQEEILDIFNTGRTIFAAIDNHDQEISICTEDEDIKKEQKDKKTKRSALVSIKKFFTRVRFTVERKKEKNFIKNKKIWWKKIRFPKLKRNDLE